MLVMKFLLIMEDHILCFLLINYTFILSNGLFLKQSPYNISASTVLGFKLDLYSSITLPDVLKVHSEGTEVAGTAKTLLANRDTLGYLVNELFLHQVIRVAVSSIP